MFNHNYKIPIVLKLSGKTSLNPKLKQNLVCSVKYADKLGVKGIGYTIYPFSPYESEMLEQFSKIQEEAREYNKEIFLWAYPRGDKIDEYKTENISYATRLAAELGADFIKVKYNHKPKEYKEVIKNSLKSNLLIAGGKKIDKEKQLLKVVEEVMNLGAKGLAIGRNIWQRDEEEALKLANEIAKIIWRF